MSPATRVIKEKLNPIPGHNEMRTKIWGVKCVTGLRYKQVGMKKYCITQAVLEPNPYMKDEGNFVSVMVVHDNGEEHLMAVLRHGQIYQVNLNMLFDRDKDVAFYLVGRGTVYLLGYEVIQPKKDRGKDASPKGVKASSEPEVEEDDDDVVEIKQSDSSLSVTPPQNRSKSSKIKKKIKKKDVLGAPEESAVDVVEDDDDEEDSDFCVEDDEIESSETESGDESEEEVEVDESEVEALVAEKEEISESIPASRKRKELGELLRTLKRSKMGSPKQSSSPKQLKVVESNEDSSEDESSVKEDSISKEDSSKEMSESDAVSSFNGTFEKPIKFEGIESSAEKKKKKKKKKKGTLETAGTPQKSNKVLLTKSPNNKTLDLKKMGQGLEVVDLKEGHGPIAARGKLVHVFYVGRLPDKSIFDSQLPGKKPLSFKMGANQVLKGLEVGLEGMKVGGKRKIHIPPNMGYGNKPPSGIPPNSYLDFTVTLQAVN